MVARADLKLTISSGFEKKIKKLNSSNHLVKRDGILNSTIKVAYNYYKIDEMITIAL